MLYFLGGISEILVARATLSCVNHRNCQRMSKLNSFIHCTVIYWNHGKHRVRISPWMQITYRLQSITPQKCMESDPKSLGVSRMYLTINMIICFHECIYKIKHLGHCDTPLCGAQWGSDLPVYMVWVSNTHIFGTQWESLQHKGTRFSCTFFSKYDPISLLGSAKPPWKYWAWGNQYTCWIFLAACACRCVMTLRRQRWRPCRKRRRS